MLIEHTATELLQQVVDRDPSERVVGDVTASELAFLAAFLIDTCPRCGSLAWRNTDCELCRRCYALLNDPRTEETATP